MKRETPCFYFAAAGRKTTNRKADGSDHDKKKSLFWVGIGNFLNLCYINAVTSALTSCRTVHSLAASPERNHVAQFGRQAAQLIGRQVQVDQVGQLGDVGRDSGEVVIVDVQCRQVGECP